MILLLLLLQSSVHCHHKTERTISVGNLGDITGVESRTKIYDEAPFSDRTTYVFRGIPYAHPVLNETRFRQSEIWNDTRLSAEGSSFDATQDGPLCQQGDMDALQLDMLTTATLEDLMKELNIPEALIEALTKILEQVFGLEDGFLAPSKLVGDVLHEWLDIRVDVSEDCLHLAVSTPSLEKELFNYYDINF